MEINKYKNQFYLLIDKYGESMVNSLEKSMFAKAQQINRIKIPSQIVVVVITECAEAFMVARQHFIRDRRLMWKHTEHHSVAVSACACLYGPGNIFHVLHV